MGLNVLLFLMLIILFLHYHPIPAFTSNNGSFLCRPRESQSLLKLKQQLPPNGLYKTFCPHTSPVTQATRSPGRPVFSNTYTPDSWNERSDCCEWEGIICDEGTGRVIGLNLSCGGMSGTIDSTSSLFSLVHLTRLDLSYNRFDKWEMNSFGFGKLRSLMHLDLTYSGLEGTLPANLFVQLPNLRILRLNENPGLTGPFPSLNRSHGLEQLECRKTGLKGNLPDSIGYFLNSLNYMDLSGSSFSGPIPESIGNLTEIRQLNFGNNQFNGRLPSSISNLRKLTILDLSYNHLEGQIPNVFNQLQNLTILFLQNNFLDSQFPLSITNLSRLQKLDISSNELEDIPPDSDLRVELHEISEINLSDNEIKGMIPVWLLNLSSLEMLNLHSNNFTGQILTKFQTKKLTDLDLSDNQLIVDLAVFSELSELQSLKISHNSVVTSESDQISIVNFTLPSLSTLVMSSCEMQDFPVDFLRNLSSLRKLDLSNNKIHGPTPGWFSSIPCQGLDELDLSFNYLTHVGDMPWLDLSVLNLQSNSLQGAIPPSISNMSRLFVLNLSKNKMSGEIPYWIGNFSSKNLLVLDLRRNEFSGMIPETIGEMTSLLSLGLNGNHLEGRLPQSLANCTALEVLDLGNNMIQDTFPQSLEMLLELKIIILKSNGFYGSIFPPSSNESFTQLRIIDLSHNNFHGRVPEELFANLQALKNLDTAYDTKNGNGRTSVSYEYYGDYQLSVTLVVKGGEVNVSSILRIFTTIDLSSNNFSGLIPESLGDLSLLRLLNLSHNNFSGNIPTSFGHIRMLEQLDLSWNQLTGGIPQALTNLTFLGFLNLSHNHLKGRIPRDKQFWTFSNDSYIGNSRLCGAPLTKECDPKGTKSPSPTVVQHKDEATGFMSGFTWKTVMMGYGCGAVVGFIVGNFMLSIGKPKWFVRLVPVEIAVLLKRIKQRNQRGGCKS